MSDGKCIQVMEQSNIDQGIESNVSQALEDGKQVGKSGDRWVSVWVWGMENWVCGGIEYVTSWGRLACRLWSKRTPHCYFYGYVVLQMAILLQ